jgi:uridine phosphorylase
MQQHDYPILEFDPDRRAIIEPGVAQSRVADMPAACVLCFFQTVIQTVCAGSPVLAMTGSEIGHNPVYGLETERGPVAVIHPGVGAPLAAAFLEEMIAMGCRSFVACGGSGVLDGTRLPVGHVIVPDSAVRDEGTSYHYLPPSRDVAVHADALDAVHVTLDAHKVPYITGKVWTTDAIYRETPGRIARRKAEGCLAVEMEAATFYAVAQFRDVPFGQILYAGDDISGDVWDHRDWIHSQAGTREKLFWLAVEAALLLAQK